MIGHFHNGALSGRLAGDACSSTPRRHGHQLEAALTALSAVSVHLESEAEPARFIGTLSETVAALCRGRRSAFWRLDGDGRLRLQPAPFGFARNSAIHEMTFPATTGADSAIERVVFADGLKVVNGSSPELDRLWHRAGLREVQSSIAAAWRAGEWRLGGIAVYDSRHGFTARDVSVLRLVGMTAGLVWRHAIVLDELRRTAIRLGEATSARRHLLDNIAAGGDEARRRFANALQDDSLQLLTAAELQVERLVLDRSDKVQVAHLNELRATLAKVEDSLRRLLTRLAPEPVAPPGDLRDVVAERLESMCVRAGIEPRIDYRLQRDVPESIRSIAIKNFNEALTNVERHARATEVTVVAEAMADGYRFEVSDNGIGFVVAESGRVTGHTGLVAMHERARLAGGWCQVVSDPGLGTRVEFGMPLGR